MEYNGSSATAAALENGEVDAMIMTDMASMGGYVPVVNIGHAEFFFGVNKNRPDILEELNSALREIQTTDPYYNEATYSRYITSSLSNAYLSKKERKWLNEHDFTVRLGYLSGNLPYCDETEENEVKGLLAVIAETFRETFGIQVETISYSSIDEIFTAAFNGEIDLFGPLYSDFWLAENSGIINSDAITSTTFILLYQGDYTEETAKKIAYANNSAIQKGAAEILFPDAEYVPCQGKEDCLNAVMDGRASCTIASTATMNLLKQYKIMNSLNIMELPQAAQICLGTLRGNSELLNITNRVIFASTEDLNGTALMDNAYADIPFSLIGYMEEHAMVVILILISIIALLIGFFLYYHVTTSRLMKMETQNEELSRQAFRDELTKVVNRAGYLSLEEELQMMIDKDEILNFALVMVDVNNLKMVNDTFGHKAGDLLIQNASKIICRIYANSPVFRIGGDEFIIVLTGADYGRRDERLSELRGKNQTITEVQQIKKGLVSLASGMAVYDKEMDHTVADVFTRADEAMYACKKQMKQKNE